MSKKISLLLFFLALGCPWVWSQGVSPEQDYFGAGVKHFYTSMDSAVYYFEKGLANYPLNQEWEKYVNCHNALTSIHGHTGNLNRSYHHAVKAYEAANNHLPKSGVAFASALSNLAIFARRKGDYDKAITLNKTALALEKSEGNIDDISIILGNLGTCYASIAITVKAQDTTTRPLIMFGKNPSFRI